MKTSIKICCIWMHLMYTAYLRQGLFFEDPCAISPMLAMRDVPPTSLFNFMSLPTRPVIIQAPWQPWHFTEFLELLIALLRFYSFCSKFRGRQTVCIHPWEHSNVNRGRERCGDLEEPIVGQTLKWRTGRMWWVEVMPKDQAFWY